MSRIRYVSGVIQIFAKGAQSRVQTQNNLARLQKNELHPYVSWERLQYNSIFANTTRDHATT
ncbi:MAG: hypothetical protein NVS2B12_07200 [Ktedonobacteraceae bacterium]